MTRKLAIFLILVGFGSGIVAGLHVKQDALQTAVIVAQAKADLYAVAALETTQNCQATREFFRK